MWFFRRNCFLFNQYVYIQDFPFFGFLCFILFFIWREHFIDHSWIIHCLFLCCWICICTFDWDTGIKIISLKFDLFPIIYISLCDGFLQFVLVLLLSSVREILLWFSFLCESWWFDGWFSCGYRYVATRLHLFKLIINVWDVNMCVS